MKEMEETRRRGGDGRILSCPFCTTVSACQHLDLQQKAGAKRGHGLENQNTLVLDRKWMTLAWAVPLASRLSPFSLQTSAFRDLDGGWSR